MGQESSSLIDDDTPPSTLESRTIDSVAHYINDGRANKIVVMVCPAISCITISPYHHITILPYYHFTILCHVLRLSKPDANPRHWSVQAGAGISTSAGIPDFRSPKTGIYANLARLNLPYPEAVFDISYFRSNPLPFYALAHELYPGKYKPTISHLFIRLLSDKGLLLKLFTQNIDCLEREAGIPESKIVEAHGSFARQRCIECKTLYPEASMREAIHNREVPYCPIPQCNGLVKPDIVFFGEQLPEEFHSNKNLPCTADLCIIIGTSLNVQPFASLPGFCSEGVPRVLINSEQVGTLGSRADDVLLLGDCDKEVQRLASALGWTEELKALWDETQPCTNCETPEFKTKDEKLENEIDTLTKEVELSLKVASDHDTQLRDDLTKDILGLPDTGTVNGKAISESNLHDETLMAVKTDNLDVAELPKTPLKTSVASLEDNAQNIEAGAIPPTQLEGSP